MKKIWVSLTILLILILLGSSFMQYRKNTQMKIAEYQLEIDYFQDINHQAKMWLDLSQLDNGAYPLRPLSNNRADVNPYFSSMAAYSLLLGDNSYSNEVYDYIDWLLSRLNTSLEDPHRVDGTLSNIFITLENGNLIEEKHGYDSVDSYTSLFIILLDYAYETNPKHEFFLNNRASIIRLFNALLSTKTENGLSSVSAGNKVQYTMDNVEVNYALKKGINLLNRMLEHSNNPELEAILIKLEEWVVLNTQAIENILWNPSLQKYLVATDIDGNEIEFKSWNNFYPDAMAQLFPLVFGVISPDSQRAKVLYNEFISYYAWEKFKFREGFYWTVVSYIGALMDDKDRVKMYIDYYKNSIMNEHAYPIYNAEVGWIIRTCQLMIDKYEAKIEKLDPLNLFR